MKRLVFTLVFVCVLLVAVLVAVMINESRLEKENAELVKKLNANIRLTVSIDVRGRYVFATAESGNATVETRRLLSDWGIYRKLEIE